MKTLTKLTSLIQWPTVFVMLALVLDNKWPALVLTLALAYRRDVSAAMRRLTAVETPGFKGRFGKGPQVPRRVPGRR